MHSDPADRAGGSATDGFTAARGVARRRRLVQVVALVGGAAGASLAPDLGCRGAALVASLIVGWMARPDRDPERWLRGAAGEDATAALLAALPRRRWIVFHDRAVPGSSANLDHVVIGPTGVWVIDTKSYRAPLRAGWRSVRAGDHRVDTAPAAWEASIVADRLGVYVRALLAVHGEGLPSRGRRVGGVPVLPASRLPRRLRRRRGSARLGRQDIRALGEAFEKAFRPAASLSPRSVRSRSAFARSPRGESLLWPAYDQPADGPLAPGRHAGAARIGSGGATA